MQRNKSFGIHLTILRPNSVFEGCQFVFKRHKCACKTFCHLNLEILGCLIRECCPHVLLIIITVKIYSFKQSFCKDVFEVMEKFGILIHKFSANYNMHVVQVRRIYRDYPFDC